MFKPTRSLALPEFIALVAVTTSIVALATDVVLPALRMIGQDLEVSDPNDPQLVITTLFLGFSMGQLLAGPLSDSFGRKVVICLGYAVFVIGCVLSVAADDLSMMLAGRILQGFGAAGPRVVVMSLIRDLYEGRAMARIMSIVMSVFILVPAVAPALGQGILFFADWQSIFLMMIAFSIVGAVWLAARQPETLAHENRRVFSLRNVLEGYREAAGNRVAMGYSVCAGLIFGAFMSYLSSAQQVFQEVFDTGELFPLYFGAAALSIGAASVVNSMLVMRLGMRKLTQYGFAGVSGLSAIFLGFLLAVDPQPSITLFMAWLLPTFFFIGLQFGNLNALAMQPLGHMAGLGAALVGSVSTIMAVPLGWFIAGRFAGGLEPLVGGFCAMGLCALVVMAWTERMPPFNASSAETPGQP
ncbi:MAG: multidrug effflux MFS transporter [Rhodospirillales bacterium]